MAGTVAVQSLLAGPALRSGLPAAKHSQSLRRRFGGFRVTATQNDQEKETTDQSAAPSGSPLKSETVKTTPPPKMKKPSTNFLDIFAFDGPAPERINGRLAMVGFAAAMAVELSRGENLFSQIQMGGVEWFVGTSVVLTLASLIPQLRGMTVESQSVAPMTSDAELWNGRLAMVGLVALAFTEYVKGGTLV